MQKLGDRAVRIPRPRGSARAIVDAIKQWQGVVDVVVTSEDVGIYFDREPRLQPLADLSNEDAPGRIVELHAIYDGPDLDPWGDLDVAEIHSSAIYTVDTIGFAPGFAYLSGLDPRLVKPRRATPRPRVPAGSIGIAGDRTAVYPFDSPGGWNLIGRVTEKMFGEAGSLLHLGDRVRFSPVAPFGRSVDRSAGQDGRPPEHPMIVVERASGLITVQDFGRHGLMHEAVPPGGALVPELLVAANRAVTNRDGAPAIEVCGRLVIRADEEVLVAVDGSRARVLRKKETLEIASHQRAAYLAIRGGVAERATLLCAGIGRSLHAGATFAIGDDAPVSTIEHPHAPGAGPVRVIPGPDLESFSPSAIDALTSAPFRILPTSDRVGTRLEGPRISREKDRPSVGIERSRPMVKGAIEIPRDEQPIVLGPEHPTTGGYPLVAVIATSDLGRFHSIPLGGTVRFFVS